MLDGLKRWNDWRHPFASRKRVQSPSIDAAIQNEVYISFDALHAPVELLGIVGSWGDTYSDEEVADELKRFNDTGSTFDEISIDMRKADEEDGGGPA